MKIYIVTRAKGLGFIATHEFSAICLTEEEAHAHAKKCKGAMIFIYDSDKSRRSPGGALYAVDCIEDIEN